MTKKVYKTARGTTIDMGAIRLQNEHVRAVGNMGVNARGDRIDAQGNVLDTRNQQIQRRLQKQTNVTSGPVQSAQKKPEVQTQVQADPIIEDDEDPNGPMDTPVVGITSAPVAEIPDVVAPVSQDEPEVPASGLAGAIARAKK